MIAVIDYDAGNIKSVEKALEYLGADARLTRDEKDILSADKVILPGVGAFGDAMSRLDDYGLTPVIKKVSADGVPFMGICLGLQLLFQESEESPGVQGLGLLEGKVLRFPADMGLKIPQIGWNKLKLQRQGRLFEGLDDPYVYFVHSYYLAAKDENIVRATADYGITFHASVESGNVFACQFHPEKSSEQGLKILENFLSLK
ncbi:MAG: imidazole glycerol phosphate synthase subunit HisH [Lachnospiraceae bacterium]|nr:imidazole glycerol phosphate synthase subunit HisH [Lachnospiraceae bacterium]